jgi:hypothetical protein
LVELAVILILGVTLLVALEAGELAFPFVVEVATELAVPEVVAALLVDGFVVLDVDVLVAAGAEFAVELTELVLGLPGIVELEAITAVEFKASLVVFAKSNAF